MISNYQIISKFLSLYAFEQHTYLRLLGVEIKWEARGCDPTLSISWMNFSHADKQWHSRTIMIMWGGLDHPFIEVSIHPDFDRDFYSIGLYPLKPLPSWIMLSLAASKTTVMEFMLSRNKDMDGMPVSLVRTDQKGVKHTFESR